MTTTFTTTEHKYPIGALVELKSGVRLFVFHHAPSRPGRPQYVLSVDMEDVQFFRELHVNYGEDALTLIKLPDCPFKSPRQHWGERSPCCMCDNNSALAQSFISGDRYGWGCFCDQIEASQSQ